MIQMPAPPRVNVQPINVQGFSPGAQMASVIGNLAPFLMDSYLKGQQRRTERDAKTQLADLLAESMAPRDQQNVVANQQAFGPQVVTEQVTPTPAEIQANVLRGMLASENPLIQEMGVQRNLDRIFAAPTEQWETVQDPLGRGGVGRVSSTTGELKNYQGPGDTVEDLSAEEVAQLNLPKGTVAQRVNGQLKIAHKPEDVDTKAALRNELLPEVPLPTSDVGEVVEGTQAPEGVRYAESVLSYWQAVNAKFEQNDAHDEDSRNEVRKNIMDAQRELQDALSPDPAFAGQAAINQQFSVVAELGKKIAAGEPISEMDVRKYDLARSRLQMGTPYVDRKTGETTILRMQLDPELFPPISKAKIIGRPGVEVPAETTSVSVEEQQPEARFSKEDPDLEQVAGEIEADLKNIPKDAPKIPNIPQGSRQTIRVVEEGKDLKAPLRAFLNEASHIIAEADGAGENIFGWIGWGKTSDVGGWLRQVPGFSHWGMRAVHLEKVLLELHLALAKPKLEESKFSNFEREIIGKIVGTLSPSASEEEIRLSLTRLANLLEGQYQDTLPEWMPQQTDLMVE